GIPTDRLPEPVPIAVVAGPCEGVASTLPTGDPTEVCAAVTTTAIRDADLEPSYVFDRTYVTRRRRTHVDAAMLLTLMIALLALIPARLIGPGLPRSVIPGTVRRAGIRAGGGVVNVSS